MRLIKENSILILILILAAILRFINLSLIPVGFNDDEAAFGYNAYSILKTGRDEWGRLLPFPVFESFGDWKLSFYLYLTVVSQFFFGLNEFATRLPSALFGVLTIFTTYLLAKKLFDNYGRIKETIALFSALFLAINPWHIIASRNAFESDLLSFFITLGTYLFLKGVKNNNLFPSTITFLTAFYVYRSAWLFVPLFILTLLFFYKHQITKEHLNKNLLLAIIFIASLIPTILTFKGQSRFIQESFIQGIARQGIINDVNENRGQCLKSLKKLPQFTCTILYNKYNYFFPTYIANYFGNLSYKTFFDKANPTGFQSFATRSAFYLFEIPFLLTGILVIFKQKDHNPKILLAWLTLAPIGAAFAGIGNYGRINLIMPAPQIIAAFGLVSVILASRNFKLQPLVVLISIIVITFSLSKLLIDIFYIEPFYTSRYQRYGYKELFNYLVSKEGQYNQFIISKKIDNSHQYIQYLYFQKVDPEYYQANVKRTRGKDGWVIFDSIGEFKFVPSLPGIDSMPEKSLLVVGEKEVTYPSAPIHTINYLNGDPGFLIYDVDQVKLKLKENEE